jgi:hypothetical protein
MKTKMKTQFRFLLWIIVLILAANVSSVLAQPYPNTGPQTVCINTNEPYGVTNTPGSTYTWSIIPLAGGNGNIASGQGTNLITVDWTNAGTCNLRVVEKNSSGCDGTPVEIFITVNPENTILLTSAAGTDNQSLCINTAITDITYATTGAIGATVTGLPAGVTGNWAGDVVTISGIPTAAGTFNYTVTLTGGCGNITATGTITVTPDNTILLTSAAGTDNQALCINIAITDITYATTGATGATVTGLPAGVTGNWAGDVVTISGTPTAAGTFNYTVTLTGGCGNIVATGTITVTPDNTILLTSAAGTDNQTLCINTAITDITYATTGATGATITGLPAGVTGNWAGDVVTISGTPTVDGIYNYTITLTGGCGNITVNGTITVIMNNTITLTSASGTDNQAVCINTAITDITYATTGATGATVTGLPAGVNGNWAGDVVTISGTPTVDGVFNYTVTLTGGCGNITATGTITVNPLPTTSGIYHN